ncbi:hypothetical protein [Endozoicomonas numazuensis]|uniref:hypothetical protein n=1 Tax=Endozoicomonas numazuensis TaxID=1137799 RepID=UPI0005586EDF|nr:hypothetical protein [Endozoicomonas numazuensis]
MGLIPYRAPSFGLFMTSVTPLYWFGMPRDVKMGGLAMDVDNYMTMAVHKQNDKKLWADYNQRTGTNSSAMEHLVPEQIFSTEDSPAEGVSAVKALTLAVAEGQKVFTITRDNLDQALASITLATEVEQEIRQGVLAGKTVTAHERNITLNGWNGAGYLIIDPETGAGAYKISGGANGGFLSDDALDILGCIGFVFGVIGKGLIGVLSVGIAAFLNVKTVLDYLAIDHKCNGLGALIALSVFVSLLGIFFLTGPLIGIALMYAGLLASKAAVVVAESKICKG